MAILGPQFRLPRLGGRIHQRICQGELVPVGQAGGRIRQGRIHRNELKTGKCPQGQFHGWLAALRQGVACHFISNDGRHQQSSCPEHGLIELCAGRSAEQLNPARTVQNDRQGIDRSASSRSRLSFTGNPFRRPGISWRLGSFTKRSPVASSMA